MKETGTHADEGTRPHQVTPARERGGLSRNIRLVIVTAGFTSLFWLVLGGLLLGWLWDDDRANPPDDMATPATALETDRPSPKTDAPDVAAVDTIRVPGAPLTIPVSGVQADDLLDTFTDARGEDRRHEAIDIMAPAGTPVVAAASGSVEKLFLSDEGGKTVYVRSPDGNWIYYYAHLAGYAPDLHEGQAIAAGRRIGAVGSTGNAEPDAPHLHFAVKRMASDEAWHEGVAINPYPLLAGRRAGYTGS